MVVRNDLALSCVVDLIPRHNVGAVVEDTGIEAVFDLNQADLIKASACFARSAEYLAS